MVSVTTVNLLALATSLPYANQITNIATTSNDIHLLSYDAGFSNILGSNASTSLVAQLPYNAFHEGGVYNKQTNAIYIASNFVTKDGLSNPINISVYHLDNSSVTSTRYAGLAEANGGTTYKDPAILNQTGTPQYQIWCDEGDFINPSALIQLDPVTRQTKPLLTSYLGRNFSSVNDVRQNYIDGSIWFSDAWYGYYQYFRPPPIQPSQVYRFEPQTGKVSVVADGFVQANGVEFSPDFKTLYVTDTGAQEFTYNGSRPATIYAFDIVQNRYAVNRRVFAYADSGIPDGIHTDTQGNVWSACGSGDGVHVWNPQGTLLGKIVVPYNISGFDGGSNNFAFLPGGVLVFNAERLWLVECAAVGREVGRDFYGVPTFGAGKPAPNSTMSNTSSAGTVPLVPRRESTHTSDEL